jgi:hypothetical protein
VKNSRSWLRSSHAPVILRVASRWRRVISSSNSGIRLLWHFLVQIQCLVKNDCGEVEQKIKGFPEMDGKIVEGKCRDVP